MLQYRDIAQCVSDGKFLGFELAFHFLDLHWLFLERVLLTLDSFSLCTFCLAQVHGDGGGEGRRSQKCLAICAGGKNARVPTAVEQLLSN